MVATFYLHSLGQRIKYGNPKVGDIIQRFCQQHDHAVVMSLLNHFYFESFSSSHVIWVDTFAYIFIKLAMFILFLFFIFNCNVFSVWHAKYFDIRKNILWNWWVDCFIARSIKWCDISGFYIESIFPFMGNFFSQENCVFFGLLISYLSLSQSA